MTSMEKRQYSDGSSEDTHTRLVENTIGSSPVAMRMTVCATLSLELGITALHWPSETMSVSR